MYLKFIRSEVMNVNLTSVVSDDGEVYFKAKDVAMLLGYERPRDAIDRHIWSKNKFKWCNIKGAVNHGSLGEKKTTTRVSTLHLIPNGAWDISARL